MASIVIPQPLPDYDGPHQPGITDPRWPAEPPEGVDPYIYLNQYAGQLERQRHLHIVTADVTVSSRGELANLLKRVSAFARHQMSKPPSSVGQREFDPRIVSRRVTVSVGFGATLFTTTTGEDRFDLAGQKPAYLKVMPKFDGDSNFVPRDVATDLVFLIASDDLYVNEYIFGLLFYGKVHPGISVQSVERGYARPDTREPSGFEDGLSNPKELPPDYRMSTLVYVRTEDDEPAWCVNGTYLAYRKVRRRLASFFSLNTQGREAVFGVHTTSGERHRSPAVNAHAFKMNPRRPKPDLFDVDDLDRRFLRRPYFFDDGLDASGEEIRGLHHVSYVRNLSKQYEWPVQMWEMNKDFPTPGAGHDALYGAGGAANIGGCYAFMPPAPRGNGDYLGSALLG